MPNNPYEFSIKHGGLRAEQLATIQQLKQCHGWKKAEPLIAPCIVWTLMLYRPSGISAICLSRNCPEEATDSKDFHSSLPAAVQWLGFAPFSFCSHQC
ncbi:hypothetical protein CEXT_787611 [Caerostris extrusa]|uniref:Uncharacterized protein n=1 Tax=Caerostris extrusa TaxID=172846 RepID=A0AAV4NT82_CAEEX|nr:hypothetical protein CEXT_787611 [Caerostris extrusa]